METKKTVIEKKEPKKDLVLKLKVEATRILREEERGVKVTGIECESSADVKGSIPEIAGVMWTTITQLFNTEEEALQLLACMCDMAAGKGSYFRR
jgi:hypothetical protein